MVQSVFSVYQSAYRLVPRQTLFAIASAQKIEAAAKKAEQVESTLSVLAALA